MGWGTFAAGLAISYVVNPGRNTANDLSTVEELEGYIEVAHHYLYQPFKRSWQRKLLRGSALLHPEVREQFPGRRLARKLLMPSPSRSKSLHHRKQLEAEEPYLV